MGHGWIPTILNFPGSKLQSFFFFFLLLCSVTLFLRSLFFLYQGSQLLWEYLEQSSMGKEFLPLSIPNSFLSLPVTTKAIESIPPRSVGKKKNLLLPQLCWKLEGPRPLCDSAQNSSLSPSFLCMLCSEITLCLYVNMDSQHLPILICLLSLF